MKGEGASGGGTSGGGASGGGASGPRLSVIVPVWRQWEALRGLLAGLAAQEGAPPFELVLVDNEPEAGGPPPALSPALPGYARIVAGPRPGSYAARNAGAAAARGAAFVFTDADCRPDPGWLAALACAADAHPGALIAGTVRVEPASGRPNPFEIYDMVRGIPQARYVARGYAATANLLVPRAAFEAAGGFDPARFSGGDAAFCRRAGALGRPIRLAREAVVAHPARADWAALAVKARRIKGGQIRAGPLPRRIAWLLRTLSPPARDAAAYLASPHPLRWRLVAVAVRLRLWGVELGETARLVAGGAPERR